MAHVLAIQAGKKQPIVDAWRGYELQLMLDAAVESAGSGGGEVPILRRTDRG